MQSLDIDLGSLALESKATDARLHLSSVARFLASEKDDIAALEERLTSSCDGLSGLTRPWTVRGHDFRLELMLRIDIGIEPGNQHALVEVLSSRLMDAKVCTSRLQLHRQC